MEQNTNKRYKYYQLTETNKGTGISLYSAGKENEISFVNFENIKVVGMETGLKLVAKNRAPDKLG